MLFPTTIATGLGGQAVLSLVGGWCHSREGQNRYVIVVLVRFQAGGMHRLAWVEFGAERTRI